METTSGTVIERFNTLINNIFDTFPEIVKESRKNRLKLVELKANGSLSVTPARTLDDQPDSITVLRAGDAAYIKYEDIYLVHPREPGRLVVQTCRLNDSGKSSLGFGTSVCQSVTDVTDDQITQLEQQLQQAVPHPNPMAVL